MAVDEQQGDPGATAAPLAASMLEPLRAALADANESDRYRLLATLLGEFAEVSRAGADGRGATDQVEALSRKVHELSEEKATLLDRYSTTKADLEHRTAQLEAEQVRGHELEPVIEEQRVRLEALQKEQKDVAARLTACEAELHKSHAENDQLLLKLQRAELANGDRSGVERLEEKNRSLTRELDELRHEMDQLRTDKDAEIARLASELAEPRSVQGGASAIPFEDLWEQLAREKPALVEGGVPPTQQSAERLVATLIELVRFVDDFDKLIRPFLTEYTKHHPPVKVPWDVYAKRDDARKTIQQVLAPVRGRPVGIVKNRLRGLYRWTEAAMIACDASIESVASELHTFAMGPAGVGADPNCTIRVFLRNAGHELFLQHVRELRGLKLAEAFGRGG